MPNNDFEGNMSHFILIAPTKKNIMLPKFAFQILETTKLHLGSQDPGSRKFSCPGQRHVCNMDGLDRVTLGVRRKFGQKLQGEKFDTSKIHILVTLQVSPYPNYPSDRLDSFT